MKTKRKRRQYHGKSHIKLWCYANNPAGESGDTGETSGDAGGGGTSTAEKSVGAELDTGTNPGIGKSDIDWSSYVPEDLRDKPYFQQILKSENPGKELVTQFDNAQKLIGSKPQAVPKDDAPDEDWNKFYETVRPEKADEYELKPADLGKGKEHITEFLKQQGADEAFLKETKELMHKHGLTKRQAGFVSDLENKFLGRIAGVLEEQATAQANLDKHFDEIVTKTFAGDKDAAIKAGREFINKLATDKTKKYAAGLPNEALMLIADMGTQFTKKYESEDSVTPKGQADQGATADGLTSEMRTLMASEAYQNPMHVDNDKVLAQVKVLSGRIAKLRQSAVQK